MLWSIRAAAVSNVKEMRKYQPCFFIGASYDCSGHLNRFHREITWNNYSFHNPVVLVINDLSFF